MRRRSALREIAADGTKISIRLPAGARGRSASEALPGGLFPARRSSSIVRALSSGVDPDKTGADFVAATATARRRERQAGHGPAPPAAGRKARRYGNLFLARRRR
jgi:hypothetical protein